MHAERLMLETDAQGRLRSLPRLPPNRRFEAIFLSLDEGRVKTVGLRRPHPDLVGRLTVLGDVMESAPLDVTGYQVSDVCGVGGTFGLGRSGIGATNST